MKLKTLLEIIDDLKNNSEVRIDLETEKLIVIREYIASTIKEHEIELFKNLDQEIDVDIDVISWVLFDNVNNRKFIFDNLDANTFAHKSAEVINNFDEILSSKREVAPIEVISFDFYGLVSEYIENRGINNKQLDYAKRFLKNISWKYKSYSALSPNQLKYLYQLINDHPIFFNNDFLKEHGFFNECEIISSLSNEP